MQIFVSGPLSLACQDKNDRDGWRGLGEIIVARAAPGSCNKDRAGNPARLLNEPSNDTFACDDNNDQVGVDKTDSLLQSGPSGVFCDNLSE